MKVVQSTQVREQIKKYKRFLEKEVVFDHSVKMNDQFYYCVQYWRWTRDRIVGYLILRPNGGLVPYEEAVPVLRLFGAHNVCVISWFKEVVEEKNKPVWMYQEKLEYLEALQPYYERKMDETLEQDMVKLIDMCKYMAASRDQIKDIHERGKQAFNETMERGYVIQEDHHILSRYLNEVNFINYQGLKLQDEIWDSVKRLSHFFRTQEVPLPDEVARKRAKLMKMLDTYKQRKNAKTADDSIRTYETYTPESHSVYHSVEDLISAFDRKDEIIFRQEVASILRNP